MSFRGLVLTDVHSNFPALQVVLAEAEREGPYDTHICAGDLVGYGSEPAACIDALGEREFVFVRGDHESAVYTGKTKDFNPPAAQAAQYNRRILNENRLEFLGDLNSLYVDEHDRFAVVHGSFGGDFENTYIFEVDDAIRAMRALVLTDQIQPSTRHITLGIFGHTHIPAWASMWAGYPHYGQDVRFRDRISEGTVKIEFGEEPRLETREKILWKPKALFNPGSVGQPRDDDPRAAWGFFEIDGERITLHYRRTPYDIAETQRRMKEAGLPQMLIDRLAAGQ